MTYRWHVEDGYAVLDRKANGECTYLTPEGCGIHGSAPQICQRFDCRELVQRTSQGQQIIRVQQNPQMEHIYSAGAERLQTLKETQ